MFVDTNTLVYASIPVSPFYAVAQSKLQSLIQANTTLYISLQILRGYIAVLSRSQDITAAIPMATLISEVRVLENEFTVLEDGPDVTKMLLELLGKIPMAGRKVHDANIVATMLVHGITSILTENVSDFNKFSEYITVIPLDQE